MGSKLTFVAPLRHLKRGAPGVSRQEMSEQAVTIGG
jgi:hypothetical protein